MIPCGEDPQAYTIEIRFEFFGTISQAEEEAWHAARAIGFNATVGAIFNENWEEV